MSRKYTYLVIAFLLLLLMPIPSLASYRTTSRPITTTGGKIDQLYLYGEIFGTAEHRGIDFPYLTGTKVY